MKKVLIKLIDIYQKIPGPWHSRCKYIPTCSNYAKQAITQYGALKGTYMAIKRILRCNPWSKGGFDPVKEKKNEKNS